MNNIVTYAVIGCAVTFLAVAAAGAFIARNCILKQRHEQDGQSCATYETKNYPPVSLIGRENTGGGQKVRSDSLVLPVADYITLIPPLGQISRKTEAKYIHLKMLSATGRTRLQVRSFCPSPVRSIKSF